MTTEPEDFAARLRKASQSFRYGVEEREEGTIQSVADGVVAIRGLPHVGSEELIRIRGREHEAAALALDLRPSSVGAVVLDPTEWVRAGDAVAASGEVALCPVGDALRGRVIDPLGRPLDEGVPIASGDAWPLERPVPSLVDRAPIRDPLLTGWTVIDALLPIGRGQRQLILGDRGTGKTTLALDAVAHQVHQDVRCVYVSIGQPKSGVVALLERLRRRGALAHTTVVVANADASPGMRYLAPYAGCTVAEWERDRGRHALVVFDDLSAHAIAYRELSLLLRRPPGREAYPGDIFYLHSRLLERATQLAASRGGGSLTALPVVETVAGRISGFIPTNLISITDGQLYLDARFFDRDIKPAVDVGLSVSRIGGRTQRPTMKKVAGKLRLDVARFHDAEPFSRFGARLEAGTRAVLERGRRIQELLRQAPGAPLSHGEQVLVLYALDVGLFDAVPLEEIDREARRLRAQVARSHPETLASLDRGVSLDPERWNEIAGLLRGLGGA